MTRESSRHRSGHSRVRIRNRPRKRRPPSGPGPRVVANAGPRAPGAPSEDDLRGRAGLVADSSRMPSPWRNRSSAPTPAPRSLSGRRAAPCSSPPRSPASSALSTRRAASSRPSAATAAPRRRRSRAWCRRSWRCATPPRQSHASDALAVAICHALAPPLLKALARDLAPAGHSGRARAGRPRPRRQRRRLPRRGRRRCAAAGRARRRSRSRRTSSSGRTRSSSTGSPTRRSASCSSTCSRSTGSGPKVALAILSGRRAGASPRDRARGHGAVRGDPRDRQEDGAAGRARAAGEDRRRVEPSRPCRLRRHLVPATRSSSSAGRSSRPSASSPTSIRSSRPRSACARH